MLLQPGTKIGRYQIQRKLARGGMGTVYVAQDPVLGRMVAVKVFVGDIDVPDAAERFGREARAAASLNHTNIVTVFDFGEVGSQPYIVMEYIQGDTITDIIRRRTAVPLSEKLRWLEELCAGAASAHKMDVVHRDIKPSNLMIDKGGRLKVLDFGIAKIVNSFAKSVTAVIGTPGYMAPEQLLGQPVDARTDIFAIGVVCFELLTYEEAFQGDSFTAVTHRIINEDVRRLSDLVPEAPPELCAVVEKCLQKNPADRYKDAESVRIALSRIRRKIEASSDFDTSAVQTIVTKIPMPGRSGPGGTAPKPAPINTRTAELTPPPNPATEREALARAQRAKIQGALQRSEGCLQNGEYDRALAAIQEVLQIEPAHVEALALQQRIAAAVARQQAATLLASARVEFQRGALTRCKNLIDEARHLDPSTHDIALERDLRLARVEEERKRHRLETVNRTVGGARSALERADLEAALALAREALSLDPDITEARDIELTALRGLEEADGSVPTVSATAAELLSPEETAGDRARPTRPAIAPAPAHAGEDETTVVALPWRTPKATATPATPAAPDVPPLPPALPPALPSSPPAPPAQTSAPVVARGASSAPRAIPDTAPAPVVVAPVVAPPIAAPARGATPAAAAPPIPATPAPAARSVSAPPPAPPPPPTAAARPVATPGARQGLPVNEWIDAATSGVSRLSAKARALPRTQLMIAAGVVAVAILAIALIALVALRGRGGVAPSPSGVVVIEARPWATVTAIRAADGTNHLTTPTATPLSLTLPAGKYTVELAGPAPSPDTRTITVEVTGGEVTVAPAAQFQAPTSEEYFKQYFGGDAPASSNPDPDAATVPEGAPAPSTGATSPAGQPASPRGATP